MQVNPDVKRRVPWTEEEDGKLRALINKARASGRPSPGLTLPANCQAAAISRSKATGSGETPSRPCNQSGI